MNADVKAEWLEALRSGKYIQGAHYLKNVVKATGGRTEYCCLGVLCELAAAKGLVKEQAPEEEYIAGRKVYSFGGGEGGFATQSSLPDEVLDWAELTTPLVDMYVGGQSSNLAYVNDMGSNFTQIADLIERNL